MLYVTHNHIFPQNPIKTLCDAILNSGPREDSTRIGRAGTVRRQAVDVAPLRRVNQALWLLCTGAREASFRNIKSIAECLADELINASKVCSHPTITISGFKHERHTLGDTIALHSFFYIKRRPKSCDS